MADLGPGLELIPGPPSPPPTFFPPTLTESQTWDPKVAAKKVAWAVSKLAAAKMLAIPAVGPVVDAFNNAGLALQPYGLTFHADPELLAKSLPFLIFAGLVSAHDAIKVKTGKSWL